MSLTSDKNILDISIHKWSMDENGHVYHSEDEPFPLYHYHNDRHREHKGEKA